MVFSVSGHYLDNHSRTRLKVFPSLTLTVLQLQDIDNPVSHMKIKKRKPDLVLILAVLVGLGVVLTMKAQASGQSHVMVNKVEKQAVYHDGWAKINSQVNQSLLSK